MDTRFFVILRFFVMYGAGFEACSFVLCGFGNILDSYTFSCVCLIITSAFGYLNIPNEFVMDHNPLTAVFTNTLGFINRYLVYEFPKKRSCQLLHFHKSSNGAYKPILVLLHYPNLVSYTNGNALNLQFFRIDIGVPFAEYRFSFDKR